MRTLFQRMTNLIQTKVPVMDDDGNVISDEEDLKNVFGEDEDGGPQEVAAQLEDALQRPLDAAGLAEFAKSVGGVEISLESDAGAFIATLDMSSEEGPRAMQGDYFFLGRSDMVEKWSELCGHDFSDSMQFTPSNISKDQTEMQFTWWDKKWIPFASEPGGDLLCFDFNPGETGTNGQVISWGTRGIGPQGQCASSVVDLIEEYINELESDKWVWSASEGEMSTREDLLGEEEEEAEDREDEDE